MIVREGADAGGWEVSEAMLTDMFGEKRVGAALSMLGGDLQRAFVVLLETDDLDDDGNAVDDDEWDYERPTSAYQTSPIEGAIRHLTTRFENRFGRQRPVCHQ